MNCQNLSGFLESKHLHWSFRTQVESKSVKCTMIMLTEDIFALKYEKLKVAKSYISETGCYLQHLLTLLLKPEQKTVIQRKIEWKPAQSSSAQSEQRRIKPSVLKLWWRSLTATKQFLSLIMGPTSHFPATKWNLTLHDGVGQVLSDTLFWMLFTWQS